LRARSSSVRKTSVPSHKPAQTPHSNTVSLVSPSARLWRNRPSPQAGQTRSVGSAATSSGAIAVPQWWQKRAELLILAKHDGQVVSKSCSWIVKSDPQ